VTPRTSRSDYRHRVLASQLRSALRKSASFPGSRCRKALKYQPDHPGTRFNLGIVRWQGKSDPKGAVQAWEQLLQKNPNYPQKQQHQGYIEKAKQHAEGIRREINNASRPALANVAKLRRG